MKKIIQILCFLLIVINAKSQSDLITPELSIQFDDNLYDHNFHIVCDGKYYYTSNGGNVINGLINKYDLAGNFIQKYSIKLDMRGLMYNSSDNYFYASTNDKGFYRITNLSTGSFTKVFSSLFEYDQASLALSPDNKYIYYLYQGTLKKFNFSNGLLVNTFYNIKCGTDNFSGDGAVAVDDEYIYTCDTKSNLIFVYDLEGNFINQFSISMGDCGISLSYCNNLLFISEDGNYNTGTWYGYKIRDKQQNDENDFTAPEIAIYEPAVSRGYKIVEANKQILVKGNASDNSGIYEVTINGIDANVNADGDFIQNVKLGVGNNTITVKATDTKSNTATYTFYVNRQEVVNNDVVINNNPINTNEKRLALVIGNSNYGGGQTLKNPANDANLMSTTLQNLGFEVIKRIDANKQSMEQAIRDFSKKLPNCSVALFYYAGHGVQVDGLNYLVPTDAKLNEKIDCKFEAISVNYVVEEFEKYPNNVNVVILDACRNDPFRSWSRGGERGFKAIAPTSGTIISFATSEGSTASDGAGNNGLFTEQLVKQMYIPQPIESVFKKTRVEVERVSNGAQSPQEWSKLKGDFYFKKY